MGDFGADRGLPPNAGGCCPPTPGRNAGLVRGSEPQRLPPLSSQDWTARAEKGHLTGLAPRSMKWGSPSSQGRCKERCTFSPGPAPGGGPALFPEGHGPEPTQALRVPGGATCRPPAPGEALWA